MTLPASPPISLAQVRAEFGAPAGTPLHSFYRGGPYVPNIAANSAVPTAPPITLHQLCGASAYQPPVITGPSEISFDGYQAKPVVTFSALAQQTVSGGNPGGSASWVRISGSAQIGCANPTTVNCTFQAGGGIPDSSDNTYIANWRLTYNDGTTVVTKDLKVTFTSFSRV